MTAKDVNPYLSFDGDIKNDFGFTFANEADITSAAVAPVTDELADLKNRLEAIMAIESFCSGFCTGSRLHTMKMIKNGFRVLCLNMVLLTISKCNLITTAINDSFQLILNMSILNSTWAGECFKPVLPPNAISWKITKLRLNLKLGTSSTCTVQVPITNVDAAQKPTGTPLETYSF